MPNAEPQPVPTEEVTPPAEEPQTPTPAPEPSPSEQPSVFETKPAEPAPAPVELPPTPETPASIEPPPSVKQLTPEPPPPPSEPPQSDPIPPPPSPTQTPQSQPSEPTRQNPLAFLQRAREKIQFRKRTKLEKIMALAAKKRSITNDDIEKLLRVSDATATRYLAELVRQGRLKPSGVRGSAKYEPL